MPHIVSDGQGYTRNIALTIRLFRCVKVRVVGHRPVVRYGLAAWDRIRTNIPAFIVRLDSSPIVVSCIFNREEQARNGRSERYRKLDKDYGGQPFL